MNFNLDIDKKLLALAQETENELEPIYKKYEENELQLSAKVLKAFQDNRVSNTSFVEVTGYGYYDEGRNTIEKIFAEIFGAEDALVRPQILSGTHALSLTLFGLLKHGDTMISISGEPYDTLKSIIGICGDSQNSLIKHGIKYDQVDLVDDDFDIPTIIEKIKDKNVKLVEIQRSRGYADRKSLSIEKIERVCKAIKQANSDVIIMVDNCYGEFVEDKEPTHVGADIVAGSLLKNIGGGNTICGGYIIGKKDLVWSVSECYCAPCVGKDAGANFNQNRNILRGLYLAPSVVCASLKTMTFASRMLEKLGYKVSPTSMEQRTDIIQTIDLETADNLVKFCQGLQLGTPVDSFVVPIPDDMPGYPHQEVMASGSFFTGSTIELSCDGPLCEPYRCYMQGGLTYAHGKLGILIGLSKIAK